MSVTAGLRRGLRQITELREESRGAVLEGMVLSSAIGQGNAGRGGSSISPLVGEMPGRAEGGAAAHSSAVEFAAPPPSVTSGDISPTRGEIGQPQQPDTSLIGFTLRHERDWDIKGRRDQKPPEGDWRTWLIMGGRGSGKTRAGAEWIHGLASAGSRSQLRIALVAETLGDAREVMIDGVSGICRIARSKRPDFEISRRRLVWPNGAIAQIFSSEDPESLRGPQFHFAWCDELAKWRHAEETFDMLQFGLRLGADPRQLVTTTPRPVPILKRLIPDPGTQLVRISTQANAGNLSPGFISALEARYGGTRLGRQELAGELIEDREDALWKRADLEAFTIRFTGALRRIVVAVDPPSGSGENSCCGIVVAGLEPSGRAVVLADCSVEGKSPAGWANAVARAYARFQADRVVAEVNQGGDMVTAMLKSVDAGLPVTMVRATRGKFLRAEPVAALYEQGRVAHAGRFAELEDQMCDFGPDGLSSGRSPDRLDALVWALTALMLEGHGEPRVRGV
ncbi:Phage DNA Packaging Protein [Neorhizobium galegae bv. orientalis]|nr:Phage DNA Packaging Protein [Neorhizobium galegae bv. orientalis]